MSVKKELSDICRRYSKHGVTMQDCTALIRSGIECGLTPAAALIGLRLELANVFGEHEYFTAADVAEVTGEQPDHVEQYVKEHEEELYNSGHIARMSFLT